MFQRLKRSGWPYSQPPNVDFDVNWDSEQADGLKLWMPWGGGTPGAHRHVDRIGGLEFTEGGAPVWVACGGLGWTLDFDKATPDYLKVTATPLTAVPITLSIWFTFYGVAAWSQYTPLYVGNEAADAGDHFMLYINTLANNLAWSVRADTRDGGGHSEAAGAITGDTTLAHHLCGVFRSATDREIYFDGLSVGTNNVNRVPVGVTSVMVGAGWAWGGSNSQWDGLLSDGRVYYGAKTASQVYEMYRNPWELWRPRIRRPWARYPTAVRIPRPPAAYNTFMVY